MENINKTTSSQPFTIIAEIGINHSGDIEKCKRLMLESKKAGATYVKIQKREPDLCVPEHQKNVMKDNTPWGSITYLEYKHKIEFTDEQMAELYEFAKEHDIQFFASVWDIPSVDLMCKYTNVGKIPSPLMNDIELCKYARSKFEVFMVSTGMSTEEEVTQTIEACNPDVIMHTNSSYPAIPSELNLNYLRHLKSKYPDKQIFYSSHETQIHVLYSLIGMGMVSGLEKHICESSNDWGSDIPLSLEVSKLGEVIDNIRELESAFQYQPGPRILFENELKKKHTLRPTK